MLILLLYIPKGIFQSCLPSFCTTCPVYSYYQFHIRLFYGYVNINNQFKHCCWRQSPPGSAGSESYRSAGGSLTLSPSLSLFCIPQRGVFTNSFNGLLHSPLSLSEACHKCRLLVKGEMQFPRPFSLFPLPLPFPFRFSVAALKFIFFMRHQAQEEEAAGECPCCDCSSRAACEIMINVREIASTARRIQLLLSCSCCCCCSCFRCCSCISSLFCGHKKCPEIARQHALEREGDSQQMAFLIAFSFN